MLRRLPGRLMGLASTRPAAVGGLVLALAIAGALLALRLEPSADTQTVVGTSTPGWAATERLHQRFGDDAVYIVVREPVTRVVLTEDLNTVLGLEGCLAGNVPAGRTAAGGAQSPCGRLARTKPARVVFGPGTFLNESVSQISDGLTALTARQERDSRKAGDAAEELARKRGYAPAEAQKLRKQAEEVVQAKFVTQLLQLAVRYGLGLDALPPRLDNQQFVGRLVFDPTKPAGTPKSRFASIFPGTDGALIQVRLRDDLSEAERRTALRDIRAATQMPQWRLTAGSYGVTGAPVIVEDLSESLSSAIILLLVVAVLVMALTLLLVFRARQRLLPLLVALAACALTFGLMSLAGVALTMASIAVVPILIGLAVDYAIQLQSRVQEEGPPVERAVARVAGDGAPTIALAAAATAAGFVVLVLSPVPMVRGFGLLLVAGIALALACALTLGVAAQRLGERRRDAPGGERRRPLERPARAVGAAWRGAAEIVRGLRPVQAAGRTVSRTGRGALALASARPRRVLGIALVLAAAGWALDTQTRVESDIQRLVPQDLAALHDLRDLQNISGVGGEANVLIEGRRVTDPAVVSWMTRYQQRVLRALGYTDKKGCGKAEICPAFSLPDLFTTEESLSSRKRIEGLLDAVPPYFSQTVITPDRRSAALSFGLRLMPLERQAEVLRVMQRELDPPPGITARLAGLPVLAAEANDRLASPLRRLVTLLAGLAAVALVLLLALRSPRRALMPLIPIVLATGWSALVLFLSRIPLNPMSIMLGALVIAIATEFSVLLSERYRRERERGHDVDEALRRTYRSTGRAVVASGVTAIAGFAVLIVSDIRMLRDFGLVTVIDLTVALLGVLVVLPAVLVLVERGELARLPVLRRRRSPQVEQAPAA
jgi:hydrophobe/amphiphile efflux-3 (HAE3) family protein